MPTLPAKLNCKKISLIPTLLCFFVVFIMVSLLTNLPITIVLAISAGFIALLLYIVLSKPEKSWTISLPVPFVLIFTVFYIFSLIVFICSPVSELVFLSWDSIDSIMMMQFAALVLLTSFFPGYVIIKIFNPQIQIGLSATIVLSFLISTFSLSIISVLLTFFCDSLNSYTKLFIISLNVILLISYLFLNRSKVKLSIKTKMAISYQNLLISAIIIFFLISVYIVYFSVLSSPRSDCFSHVGDANKILKGIFPWEPGGTITYPFLFHFNLATHFSASSLPIVNSYTLLVTFVSLIPLSFYSMLKSFDNLPKIVPAIATTFFSLGSGLGWIYTTYLRNLYPSIDNEVWKNILNISVNPTLIDIQFGCAGLSIWGYQPSVIGLVVFFGLTYLLQSKISNQKFLLFTITSLVCYGYLIHVSEIVLFVFIILSSFIVIKKSHYMSNLRKRFLAVSVGLILAYLLIFILNIKSPENISVYSTSVSITLIYLGFLTIVSFIKGKIRVKVNLKFAHNLLSSIRWPSLILLVYVIGLSFIIWLKVYPTFLFSYVSESGLLPWYFYSFKIGIIGIIGLLTILFLVFKRKFLTRDLMFFIILTLTAFFIGRVISFVNLNLFDSGYWEFRILPFSFIGLAVLASFSCYSIFRNSSIWRLRKKVFASLLLGVLILTSVMSTIHSVEHWTLGGSATKEDYDSLNYLNSKDLYSSDALSKSFPVLTVSSRSDQFSKLSGVTAYPLPELLFKPSHPEMFTSILSTINAKYVYMSKGDYDILNTSYPSGFFSQFLLNYSPRIYSNNVSIVELPHFSTPKPVADLAIIRTPEPSTIDRLIIYSAALGELDYSLLEKADPSLFESKQIILNSDLSNHLEIPFKDNWTFSEGTNFSKNNETLNVSVNNVGKPQILMSDADVTFNSMPVDNQMTVTLNIKVNLGTNDFIGLMIYDLDKNVWTPLGSIYSDKGTPPGWASPLCVENEKWTKISFNLNADKIAKIGGIRFRFLTQPDSYQSFEINKLMISDYESMMFPLDKLINWVENGGHLIIFSQQPGFFSNLLSIRQTDTSIANYIANITIPDTIVPVTSSTSPEVDVLGYYSYADELITPYAYAMEIGSGKVSYLEISPYLNAMENSEDRLKYNLLMNISSILKSLDEFTLEKLITKSYPIMTKLGNFSGHVEVTTNFFFPEGNNLLWDSLVTSGSNVIVDGKEIKNFSVENVQLSEFSFLGDSNSFVNSTIMKITPEQSGYYFKLLFEKGFNWTLNLNPNSILKFKIVDEVNTKEVQIKGGSVEFGIQKSLSTVVKTPKLFVNGIAQFQSAHFWSPFDWLSCLGNPVTLKGDMYFVSELTDSGTVLFSDFNINGDKEVEGKQTAKWSEWNIPWFDVFLSLENFVLIIILLIIIQQAYIINKSNSKTKTS